MIDFYVSHFLSPYHFHILLGLTWCLVTFNFYHNLIHIFFILLLNVSPFGAVLTS
jgi:hypothetical protein